ncbi:MAG TPA: DUF2993 domain-containing protein [Pilimelia sp.]|nr:DUF2993 domain-containing protein [Pilimelia sp.]
MADVHTPQPARPKRRRGIKIVIILLLMLVSLTGLDRFGVLVAEEQISATVSDEMTAHRITSRKPDVDVRGFPFLTQVLAGTYRDIAIHLVDVRAEGGAATGSRDVRLPVVDIRAGDVRAGVGDLLAGRRVVAGTVAGTATVDYATVEGLSRQEGLKLAPEGGRVRATMPVDVLGRQVTVTGLARLEPAQNVVRLRFDDLDVRGIDVSDALRAALRQQSGRMGIDLALPALPYPVTIERVEATPAGLRVTGSSREVPLR